MFCCGSIPLTLIIYPSGLLYWPWGNHTDFPCASESILQDMGKISSIRADNLRVQHNSTIKPLVDFLWHTVECQINALIKTFGTGYLFDFDGSSHLYHIALQDFDSSVLQIPCLVHPKSSESSVEPLVQSKGSHGPFPNSNGFTRKKYTTVKRIFCGVWMGSKFCVKFQRAPFWTHTPQNKHFTVFKASGRRTPRLLLIKVASLAQS